VEPHDRAHLLHDRASGALTGLLDWGEVTLGHAYFDLAIIGAFCGPGTLAGVLERMETATPTALELAFRSC
jgi:aminoglycoside phosphotransferase (APT) family kinase protein